MPGGAGVGPVTGPEEELWQAPSMRAMEANKEKMTISRIEAF